MNDAGKVAFTPKGDYSSTVTYEYLDTVVYDGNAYAALKTTTGNAPEEGSEYWALLARGGTSVPVATEVTEGVVKASDDIGVDSDAKMILRTDFAPQENLTELESGESRNTFFGKIAKAVIELISHINVKASTSVTGHVKLSDSSAVTDSTGLALPATEKNASISGTMANQISELNTKFVIGERVLIPKKTIVAYGADALINKIENSYTRSGYRIAGILGVDLRNLNLFLHTFEVSDTNTIRLVVSNNSGNNIEANPFVRILYSK